MCVASTAIGFFYYGGVTTFFVQVSLVCSAKSVPIGYLVFQWVYLLLVPSGSRETFAFDSSSRE